MWALLPQGVYPLMSRNSILSHYGGVIYGTLNGKQLGKLEYRAWGGARVLGENDGYFLNQIEEGLKQPNGSTRIIQGAAIHWKTPLPGFMIGASDDRESASTTATTMTIPSPPITFTGTEEVNSLNKVSFFGRYEHNKIMVAAEHFRFPVAGAAQFISGPSIQFRVDQEAWYAMASYKVAGKFTAGLYDTQYVNRQNALGPDRYSKDWAVSGRYDFNQFLYAKAEEHFIDGTAIVYDYTANNVTPGAASPAMYPNTKLTILKIGVNF
jgi:hypothetical protein